ncbi:MAG: hypothetical protein Q8R02_20460 [Hyphomonadaceae bacterium]|nr:hypothetical protein [Hyphomonadaceae bacterium]
MIRGILVFIAVLFATPAALAQVGGNLAAYPPVDIGLDIKTSADGAPVLSKTEFKLVTGEYYRFTVKSDGGKVWRVEVPDLLQNSHLRVVTINDVEVHLQSLMFRALEFDKAGTASFAFTPIRPGIYQLYVGNDPYSVGRPIGEAGVQPAAKAAFAKFVVE